MWRSYEAQAPHLKRLATFTGVYPNPKFCTTSTSRSWMLDILAHLSIQRRLTLHFSGRLLPSYLTLVRRNGKLDLSSSQHFKTGTNHLHFPGLSNPHTPRNPPTEIRSQILQIDSSSTVGIIIRRHVRIPHHQKRQTPYKTFAPPLQDLQILPLLVRSTAQQTPTAKETARYQLGGSC
jgi:hypothetical protein